MAQFITTIYTYALEVTSLDEESPKHAREPEGEKQTEPDAIASYEKPVSNDVNIELLKDVMRFRSEGEDLPPQINEKDTTDDEQADKELGETGSDMKGFRQKTTSRVGAEKSIMTIIRLRIEGEDLAPKDVKKILFENGFYSSCWTYNGHFCNPDGAFGNTFTENKDGTVIDLSTHLSWEKGGSLKKMTWKEAESYIQELNRKGFGGHNDWRLPTVDELGSLLESAWTEDDLFIDPIFDEIQNTCWSSDFDGPARAWKANFQMGFIINTPRTFKNYVRAVRSGVHRRQNSK